MVMLTTGVLIAATTLGVAEYFHAERIRDQSDAHALALQKAEMTHATALGALDLAKDGLEAELDRLKLRNDDLDAQLRIASTVSADLRTENQELRTALDTQRPPSADATDPMATRFPTAREVGPLTIDHNLREHFGPGVMIPRAASRDAVHDIAAQDALRVLTDPDFDPARATAEEGPRAQIWLLAQRRAVAGHSRIRSVVPHFLFTREKVDAERAAQQATANTALLAFIDDLLRRRHDLSLKQMRPKLANVTMLPHAVLAQYHTVLRDVRLDEGAQPQTVILNEMVLFFEAQDEDARWLYTVRARFTSDFYDHEKSHDWKTHVALRWNQMYFITGIGNARNG
ncbi:MAG: hypothetical protein AAFR46_10500 [Pseudomonadota bacterium]